MLNCTNCVFNNKIEPNRYCYIYHTKPNNCNNFKNPKSVEVVEIDYGQLNTKWENSIIPV